MLSNTSKYALRAVIYLAMNKDKTVKTGIKKISEELEIPAPFLGKILQSLAKQKLLNSTKGPNGGFSLAKDPEDVFLIDIVEIIDGIEVFEKCGIGVENCMDQDKPCAIHSRYAGIREEMKKLFSETSINEMVLEIQEGKSRIII